MQYCIQESKKNIYSFLTAFPGYEHTYVLVFLVFYSKWRLSNSPKDERFVLRCTYVFLLHIPREVKVKLSGPVEAKFFTLRLLHMQRIWLQLCNGCPGALNFWEHSSGERCISRCRKFAFQTGKLLVEDHHVYDDDGKLLV